MHAAWDSAPAGFSPWFDDYTLQRRSGCNNRDIHFLAIEASIKIVVILPYRGCSFPVGPPMLSLRFSTRSSWNCYVAIGLTKMQSAVQSSLTFLSFWIILIIILSKPCRQILLTYCHPFPPLPMYWRLSTCSKVITNLFIEVTPCRFLYGHESYKHFQNQICIKPNIYGLRETTPVRIPDGLIPEVSTCKSIASLAAPVSWAGTTVSLQWSAHTLLKQVTHAKI